MLGPRHFSIVNKLKPLLNDYFPWYSFKHTCKIKSTTATRCFDKVKITLRKGLSPTEFLSYIAIHLLHPTFDSERRTVALLKAVSCTAKIIASQVSANGPMVLWQHSTSYLHCFYSPSYKQLNFFRLLCYLV